MIDNVRNDTIAMTSLPRDNIHLSYQLLRHEVGEATPGSEPLADEFTLPKPTNLFGEFDMWHPINSPLLSSGEGRGSIQTLDQYTGASTRKFSACDADIVLLWIVFDVSKPF